MDTYFEYCLHKNIATKRIKSKRTGYININNQIIISEKSKNLNSGFKKNKEISKTSIKKIRTALQWLSEFSKSKTYVSKNGLKIKYRISFITLTLASPQIHSDKEIVSRCLNSWLTNMRANYGLRNYIWRAEKQKNGNIHFHIATDANPNHYMVLYSWNKAQNLLGYVDRYQLTNNTKEQPPSTQIKRANQSHKIDNYISKYLSKGQKFGEEEKKEEVLTVDCRHYSISYELSKIKEFQSNTKDLAELIYTYTKYNLKGQEVLKDFCGYIKINLKRLYVLISGLQSELKKRFYNSTKFVNSRLILNSNYSANQNRLIFEN